MPNNKQNITQAGALGTLGRITRLPLDFIRLSLHLLRAVPWLVYHLFRRRSFLPDGLKGPFGCGKTATLKGYPACGPAGKYGSPILFRAVCAGAPAARDENGEYTCRQIPEPFRPPWPTFLAASLALTMAWIGLAVGVLAIRDAENLAILKDRFLALMEDGTSGPAASDYMAKGAQFLDQQRYREAMLAYRNALQRLPQSPDAHYGAGMSYQGMEDHYRARRAFEAAIRLDPGMGKAHLALGKILLAGQSVESAIRHARTARALMPGDPEPKFLAAACLRALHRQDEAIHSLEAGLAMEENPSKEMLTSAGDLYAMLNRPTEAEACYRRILEENGDGHTEIQIRLAAVLRRQGKTEAARTALAPFLEGESPHPGALTEAARLLAAEGRISTAVERLEEVAKRAPAHLEARALLAALLIRSGRSEEGLKATEKLLAEHPAYPEGNLVMAELFQSKGFHSLAGNYAERALAGGLDNLRVRRILIRSAMAEEAYDKAMGHIDAALSMAPNSLEMKLAKGMYLERTGEAEGALAFYRNITESHPDASAPWRLMGNLHLRGGNLRSAIDAFENLLQRNPNSPLAMNNVAMLLLHTDHEIERAFDLARRLTQRFPNNPIFADTAGWAYLKKGHSRKSIELLSNAANRLPANPAVRFHLGAAYYKTGDLDGARRELKKAFSLAKPFLGQDQARRLLAALNT